jgi:hypothetical protein
MEPEHILQWLQESATESYPEPGESSQQPRILLRSIHILSSIYV